jgi:hypothetical protein
MADVRIQQGARVILTGRCEEVNAMSTAKMVGRLILLLSILGLVLAVPCLAQQPADQSGGQTLEAPSEEPEGPPQEESTLQVTATICTEIVKREPVGAGESFPATVEKLFCHTLVEGAQDNTSITHVWYYGDRIMAEVPLAVNSVRWRTWSSKRMMPGWTGAWRVDIQDENGTVLTSASFRLE